MTASWGACAPPRVSRRLGAAPDGPLRVLHTGRHAVYVELDGWCLGVVGPGATQVPCAVRVTDGQALATAREVRVAGGQLHLDGRALRLGRVVATAVPPLRPGLAPGPVPDLPDDVAGRLTGHRLDAAAADRLLGLGDGLTPLGDDVVAGWLALHRAAGVPTPAVDAVVAGARSRTTLLSATLLDCARRGEVLPQYAAWVRAIGSDAEPAAVRRLHDVGGSSGAGLHLGGVLALAGLGEAA